MVYGSVCSGIEAATVAWHPLGWKPAFFSEIDKFPREVLAHHYPHVPLHGDFTTIKGDEYEAINLLVGGTPCQSFSVAGLRKGLDDPRGNLMLEFGALARRTRAEWLVWENVPGVLSSNGGRDFGSFLGMLGELGYGFAYRVLDAQFFGVAQRRRRVFVVGRLGDWRSAAAVLFERDSLQGNPAPSRKERQEVTEIAGTLAANGGNGLGADDSGAMYTLTKTDVHAVAFVQNSRDEVRMMGGDGSIVGALAAETGAKQQCYVAFHPTQDPISSTDGSTHAIGCGSSGGQASVAVACFKGGQGSAAGGIGYDEHVAPTLSAADSGSNRTPTLMQNMQVRRLTPRECERLQGFQWRCSPDYPGAWQDYAGVWWSSDYTLIPYGKAVRIEKLEQDWIKYLLRGGAMTFDQVCQAAADGPRYKALGNSMAVPVMRWIGERIKMVADMRDSTGSILEPLEV